MQIWFFFSLAYDFTLMGNPGAINKAAEAKSTTAGARKYRSGISGNLLIGTVKPRTGYIR